MNGKPGRLDRREFLRGAGICGAAGLVGVRPGRVLAEPPPETTKLRLVKEAGSICIAPQYAAEELLKAEGFTDVEYLKLPSDTGKAADAAGAMWSDGGRVDPLAAGIADMHTLMVSRIVAQIDADAPISVVTGIHSGCFELFGTDRIRSVKDLKGKAVAVPGLGSSHHLYVASIASYVGIDARKDITFVTPTVTESIRLFRDGKVDAIMGFPPIAQELRASRTGHVVVDSRVDRPWSQYFCCMLAANGDFVHQHPVATKRAMRAILKANDLCALEPDQVARRLVDAGYTARYDTAAQALRELPYAKWRDYDAEDTVRFYALRLHEAGLIKSTPQKIIAQGTDWRFLNELRRELRS
jgi:NitT/TauT family transport system substrate-binding protein